MKKNIKSPKQKLYISVMMAVFMWVIIGDLVSFHIEILSGNKFHGTHQPFTKTQKDEGRTFKVKEKTKDNSSKSKRFVFIYESETLQNVDLFSGIVFKNNIQSLKTDFSGTAILLRGPPVL